MDSWSLLFLIAFALLWGWIRWLFERRRRAKAVDSLLATNQDLYGQPHCFRPVQATDFSGHDLLRYDATMKTLEAMGFRFLADLENVTVSQARNVREQSHRTFIRCFLHTDGTIDAGCYEYRLRGIWQLMAILPGIRRRHFVVDLETALEGDSWIVTNTSKSGNLSASVPGVDDLRLDEKTPLPILVQRHRQRLAEAVASGRKILPNRNLKECLAMQARLHAHKSRHKLGAAGLLADFQSVEAGILLKSPDLRAELARRAKSPVPPEA